MTVYQKEKFKGWMDNTESTLAIAESLTAGMVQAQIGGISGASTFYLGGITAYTIDAKAQFLGVDKAHAISVNAVSERVVEEMARGVSAAFGSTIGVATTGYAEPYPAAGVSVPHAYIAVYIKNTDSVTIQKVVGEHLNRNEMRTLVTEKVLDLLLKQCMD